jgi:hypothetical protein
MRAPRRPKAIAVARPTPAEAPVIITTCVTPVIAARRGPIAGPVYQRRSQ